MLVKRFISCNICAIAYILFCCTLSNSVHSFGELRKLTLNTKQAQMEKIKNEEAVARQTNDHDLTNKNGRPRWNSNNRRRHRTNLKHMQESAALNEQLKKLVAKNQVNLAEELLLSTLNDFQKGLSKSVRPDNHHFGIVITGWGRSGFADSPQRAEQLMNKMIECYRDGSRWLKPNKFVYSSVVNCWSVGVKGSAARAEELLRRMERVTGSPPNFVTYSTVIKAWAKEGRIEKAEELLITMESLYEQGNEETKPNTITYNLVLEAFAKSGKEGSAHKAEKLLKRMDDLFKNGNLDAKPDVKSYSNCIDAWAASNEMDAPQRAEELLRQIELQFLRGNTEMKPSVVTYGTVIKAWTRNKNPQRAEEILKRMEKAMVKPNSVCFYMIIVAWACSGEIGSAQRSELLLKRMQQMQEHGHKGVKTNNPDVKIYTAVIDAWVNSAEDGAPERAEELVNEVEISYQKGNTNMKPNIGLYNALLRANYLQNDVIAAARRADDIFVKLLALNQEGDLDVEPNRATYRTIVLIWSKIKTKEASSKMAYYKSMFQRHNAKYS